MRSPRFHARFSAPFDAPRAIARSVVLAGVMLAAITSTSCFDPEHKDEVNALGGEINGVGPGPYHRPGQPCSVCHGGSGPGKPQFSISGTIYGNRDVGIVKPGVLVTITDVTGDARTLMSNEAGNFYVSIDEWSPTFPVNTKLSFPGVDPATETQMQTPIGRNGSCAICHYGADNEPTHMPPVYLQP